MKCKHVLYTLALMVAFVFFPANLMAQPVVRQMVPDVRDELPIGDLFYIAYSSADGDRKIIVHYDGDRMTVVVDGTTFVIKQEFILTENWIEFEAVTPLSSDENNGVDHISGFLAMRHGRPVLGLAIQFSDGELFVGRATQLFMAEGMVSIVVMDKCECKDRIGFCNRPVDCEKNLSCSADTSVCILVKPTIQIVYY